MATSNSRRKRSAREGAQANVEITGVRRLTPDMRREQTRTYLLEAASAVFAAKGFHPATLDEIAEAAGFTKGAIYSNFGGKEELFLALVERRRAAMLAEFFPAASPVAHPDTTERLDAISKVYRRLTPTEAEYALWAEFELYALRNPALRAQLREQGRLQFAALVALVDHYLRDLGITDPPLPVEDLAHLFVAIFDSLARQRALDPETVPDELFARLVTFINAAIVNSDELPPSGRRRSARPRRRRSMK